MHDAEGSESATLARARETLDAGRGQSGRVLKASVLVVLIVLAFAAAGMSLMLTAYHLSHGRSAGAVFGLVCEQQGGGCERALQSRWGYFSKQKIPVAGLGVAYFTILGVWYLIVGRPNRRGRWWHLIPLWINGLGVCYSLLLVWVMVSVLREICGWCALTHGMNIVMLVLGVVLWPGKVADVGEPARPTFRLGLAGVLLIGSVYAICIYKLQAAVYARQAKGFKAYADRYRLDADLMRYAYLRSERRDILVRPDDPMRGGESAGHTVVVFGDFGCRACKSLAELLEESILPAYGDGIRVVYKHYPLDGVCNPNARWATHFGACAAAEAAEAARELGGNNAFWKMHDLLFEEQDGIMTESWAAMAEEVSLDGALVAEQVGKRAHRSRIEEDVALGNELGVTGTPTVFIDGKRFREWQQVETWNAILGPAGSGSSGDE